MQDHRIEHGEKAGWLAPIPPEAKRKKVREKETDRRAGNKGCLPMSLDDYLELLDWTGRQFRTDKHIAIPAACAPILDRVDCSEETWFDLVKNFRKRFRNEAGSLPSVRAFRSKRRARRAQAATAGVRTAKTVSKELSFSLLEQTRWVAQLIPHNCFQCLQNQNRWVALMT